MAEKPSNTEALESYVSRQKVATITDIIEQFLRSRATIYRMLSQIDYITSYNRNRSGITLTSIPHFDSWGIWKFKDFHFSRWKNLRETIQNIVNISSAGLYPRNIQDILGVRIYNHLSRCVTENRIIRNSDFGYPIYFSMFSEIRQKQYENRTKIFRKKIPHEMPLLGKENVIRVLVAIIKHHETKVEKLVPILETKGPQFSEEAIKWVLKKFRIEKKGSL